MKTRLLIYFHLLFFLLKECVYQVECTSTRKINTNQIRVDVVTSNKTGKLKRFWQNTGMSAPGPGRMTVDYLTSRTQKINLALIGALPFRAIAHVRIHWLLDLISVRQESEKIVYNFKTLDKFVSWLNQNDLHIGFELMGNPGGVFTDLGKNASQFEMWKELVYKIASKYKAKYGLSEIKRWRFETWNEPDLKIYNNLNFDLKGYLNYVQASKEGLNKCSSKLRLSGPAGLFKEKHNHHLCWGLLNHCENQIIQNNSCYIDTITFHKKGNGSAIKMVEESLQWYRVIQNNFPHLSHLSAANDEADMLTGWWREEDWRGDVRYASSVIEAIVLFYQAKKQGKIPLKHISNDNAFLNTPPSYFNQRTLLTRFIINNSNGESHDQFIRKPVMIAMAMAAYLDGFEVQYILKPNYSNLSVLATCNDIKEMESCAVLLTYNSDLKINLTKTYVEVNIKLTKHTDISLFIYVLDNNMIHPESVWTQAGKPSMPSANLLRKMRQVEGPHRIYGKKLKNVKRNLKIQLQITMPSIALIHICKQTDKMPNKVKLVHALNITYNELLLIWKDSKIGTRCVKTYELQFCAGYCKSNLFKRINNEDIILLGYQYVPEIEENMDQETTVGLYRVRVVDYWGRKGIFSNIISYGLSFI